MEIDRIHSVIFSYMNENYNLAIEECDRVLEKNGTSYLGRIFRAFSLIKKGLYDDAISDLNEAEKIQANTYEIYFHRGMALFYNEKFKEALDQFNKAIEVPEISDDQRDNTQKWINKAKLF